MQIIIVGCGKVGKTLTSHLSKENNNITVIDNDTDKVNAITVAYDVLGVAGNAANYSVLIDAGIEEADILIAVTESDELNLLCCVIAKKASGCNTIARVRNPVYGDESEFLRKELGLSLIINPDLAAAHEVANLLRFPLAIDIDIFKKGRVEVLRFRVPNGSMLSGASLKDISAKLQIELLVCIVQRKKEIVIPDGNYILHAGDLLSIVITPRNAVKFFKKIGIKTQRIQNIIIVGGGEIAYYLATLLQKADISVKIIERNRARCEELSKRLPDAMIINGDGSDQNLLLEEHIENADAFLASTDIDEENIILSLYARGKVKYKTVTKISHLDYTNVIHELNLDSTVHPKYLTAEHILQYVRALENSKGSNVETLFKLVDGEAEALEFFIRNESDITNVKLQDLTFKKNLLIACIEHKGKLIIPTGQDIISVGDYVIVVTTHSGLQDIQDTLDYMSF